MITLDEMQNMLEAIVDEVPAAFFRDLSGGITLSEEAVLAPEAVDEDLFTLGEYCEDEFMGRCIVIYYGSFAEVFSAEDAPAIEEELRETLFHEFTHHLESLAGEYGLEEKDADELASYFKFHADEKHSKK